MAGGGCWHPHRQDAENHQAPPRPTPADSPAQARPPRPLGRHAAAERDWLGDGHLDEESPRNPCGRGHGSADFSPDGGTAPLAERELQPPRVSRRSLFSGMQLVARGRAQRHQQEAAVASGDGEEDNGPVNQQPGAQAPPTLAPAPAGSSPPPSAFSFLNL